MPLFIECSLHQNGNTQGVHSDDKLFLPPSPQVTCQATDIRSVIGKWISHLLLYRWVCKEPFYIAYIACYNAVAFFFFFFSPLGIAIPWLLGVFFSSWLWRHMPAVFRLLVELKLGGNTSFCLCFNVQTKNTYIHGLEHGAQCTPAGLPI